MAYIDLLRWLHIIGACVLFGTGAGIAFFMLMAHRTRDPHLIAHTASIVVTADILFTASAVLIQPVTGLLLANAIGWPLSEGWIVVSIVLYVMTGLCWLPVVWIQARMRNLARAAVNNGTGLPPDYETLFRTWVLLGIPAFVFVLGIIWLMIAKPTFAF